jgi:hypothetical protein
MADKEDSIHIRIKIDVDEADKQFTEDLASNLAKSDEGQVSATQKNLMEKTFRELQEKHGLQGPLEESEGLERKIKEINKKLKKKRSTDVESLKEELTIKKNSLQLKQIQEGPLGVVQSFTKEQTANLSKFTSNPSSYLIAGLGRILGKYGKAAMKGGIYAIIALLVYETVLFVFDQMMAPGRAWDRRFKRIARLETMNFYERQLQENLRQGYAEIRVTTQQGLRGGASQVNGNLFEFGFGATGIVNSTPYRSNHQIYQNGYVSGNSTDRNGSPRRITQSGRFG